MPPARSRKRQASRLKDVRSDTNVRFSNDYHRLEYYNALTNNLYANLSHTLWQHEGSTRETLQQQRLRISSQYQDSFDGDIEDQNHHVQVELPLTSDYPLLETYDDGVSDSSELDPEGQNHTHNSNGNLSAYRNILRQLRPRRQRTNKDNLLAEAANWRANRTKFVDSYINSSSVSVHHVCDAFCRLQHNVVVNCIDFDKFAAHEYSVCSNCTIGERLISCGFFPSTPERPSLAFSINLLRHFQAVQEHGKCSKDAYANGTLLYLEQLMLKELIPIQTRHHFAEHFHDAHAHWLTVETLARASLNKSLNRTHASLSANTANLSYVDSCFEVGGLHEMCPACFGWSLSEKVPPADESQGSPLIVCFDGNMQHKRFKQTKDTEYANTHPTYTFTLPEWSNLPGFDPDSLLRRRQHSDIQGCERHFLAADERIQTNQMIDEPGLVLASCRHGSQLRLFNMLPGLGERRAYAVLLADELARTNTAAKVMIMYDIACQFDSYAMRLAPATLGNATYAIPALHGYAHQFQCQVRYHCRFSKGYGLSDGENVERNWSEMDRLVSPLRCSTKARRLHTLCNFVRSAARRKRVTFGKTIVHRWQTAKKQFKDATDQLTDAYNQDMQQRSEIERREVWLQELRSDIADRETFYKDAVLPAVKNALDLEPIDLLFQLLFVMETSSIPGLANGVPLPFQPSLTQSNASHLSYDLLWAQWQALGDDTLFTPENRKLRDNLMCANECIVSELQRDDQLFSKALARGFSRQLIVLRRRIWIKWSDNVERSKRLRASKTGKRGSAMILQSITRASQTLHKLIAEHNALLDVQLMQVPLEAAHTKLEQARLDTDVGSPGFLLMPVTALKHRWMLFSSRTRAMEHICRLDRALEEMKLLKKETERLVIFYTGRCNTLHHALNLGNNELLLMQVAFVELRCFWSVLSAIRAVPELGCQTIDVDCAHSTLIQLSELLDNPCIGLMQFVSSSAADNTMFRADEWSDVEDGETLEDEEGNGLLAVIDAIAAVEI